jgi:hypothetical protein
MRVTFGASLDARQGPSAGSFFDEPLVGPMGLLGLLETYLGLAAPEVPVARRVAIYLGALQQADAVQPRFYRASLVADGFGTAAWLLDWRDTWMLGGWAGQAGDGAPPRIADLAAAEQAAAGTLPPGLAERLAACAAALRATGSRPFSAVTLLEPPDTLPRAWQQVLALLPGVTVQQSAPQGSGALRRLQQAALQAVTDGRTTGALPDWADDGSVACVRAPTATAAEHWLGALHAAQPQADRLVVAETRGSSLDTTLEAIGSVRCGFETASALRPPLQALGLALDLYWDPLDIGRVVDFLTHPVGPFSRSARQRLAEAVADQPGIGGPEWTKAREAAVQTAAEDGDALRENIAFWLEGPRFSRDAGLPVAHARACAERLREAFRRRLGGSAGQAAVFGPAHRQCATVADSLAELAHRGQAHVSPRELEQLLARATPQGSTSPDAQPQVGCMRSAGLAAACVEPADEVLWWMPAAPALPAPAPWSAAERRALQDLGVALPDPAQALAALSQQWLRPLLAARQRFVLVLPPEGTEVHPTRQLLQQLVPGLERAALDVSACPGLQPTPVARQLLPAVPRYLQLPAPVALPEGQLSYTALNELFNAPALHVLKKVARLKPTEVLAAEDGNRLLGVLAHRVFEQLFSHTDALAWSDEQALAWLRGIVGPLLQTEGATLLMQGAGMGQQRFRLLCERAVCALLAHLREAGAERVQTEAKLEGHFADASLGGTLDLLVHLPGGRCAVIDMKWSGTSRYRELLAEGGHLQLALYSSLVEQQPPARLAPVALGYFIIDSRALLVSHPGVFPRGSVHAPPGRPAVPALLAQAQASWAWRTGQLAKGCVEVVPPDPPDDHAGPEGTLPVQGPNARWERDHLVLLGGWE